VNCLKFKKHHETCRDMITFLVSKYSEQLMVFNRALREFLAWKYFSNSGTDLTALEMD